MMIIWRSEPILHGCQIGPVGMRQGSQRSDACSRTILWSMGCAKSGGRFAVRVLPSLGRLIKITGIQGSITGKPHRTTVQDKKQPCLMDRVNRPFRVPAPNRAWASDFAYVAFVIDAYARKIVGCGAAPPHLFSVKAIILNRFTALGILGFLVVVRDLLREMPFTLLDIFQQSPKRLA